MALPFQNRQRPLYVAPNLCHSFRNNFDTVAVSGFSSNVHPLQIVNFFTLKEGHCQCVSTKNYPPSVLLRFNSPIVAQTVVLRYDNVVVFGQRLRVAPASIHWEQGNEINIPLSPPLHSSYTPCIFPRRTQPHSMTMPMVRGGTSILNLAKVFLVQKALPNGRIIQNPRKIETHLLQRQRCPPPKLGNTPNRSASSEIQKENMKNLWKPSNSIGNLQNNTSKESSTSKPDDKNTLARNEGTAHESDKEKHSENQTAINREELEDEKMKGPVVRRTRRKYGKNNINDRAADFKNSSSAALSADKKIVKGNNALMKKTEQSLDVEVKCPTMAEKDSEKDAGCRETAQNFDSGSGITTAIADNNDNITESKTLTHSDDSQAKTEEECQENNVNVSDVKSSNYPVDGDKTKCDKNECKQSVSVNKVSYAAKNYAFHNSEGGTTQKCSTGRSQEKSGGNESNKAELSSGAGKESPKEKGCSKNNASSENISKDKGFLKSNMKDFSQEASTNGFKTSIAKERLEATNGFPKAGGAKNGMPQRNMATEKHCVTTSGDGGRQKQNQTDVNEKNLKRACNSNSKSKTEFIKGCLKNNSFIGEKSLIKGSTTTNNGRDLSDGRKPAKDAITSTKISPQNSGSIKNSRTQHVLTCKKSSSQNNQKKCESNQMKRKPAKDRLETTSDKSTSNDSSQARIDIQNGTQGNRSKENSFNSSKSENKKNSFSNCRQANIQNSGKKNVESLMSIVAEATQSQPRPLSPNRSLSRAQSSYGEGSKLCPKLSDEPKDTPQRYNGVKRKRKEPSDATRLVVAPSKKTCLENRSSESKGNDTTATGETESIKSTNDLRDLFGKKKTVIWPKQKIPSGGNQKLSAKKLVRKNQETSSVGKSAKTENQRKNMFIVNKGQAVVKTSAEDTKRIDCSTLANVQVIDILKNSDTNNDASTEKKAEKHMKNTSTDKGLLSKKSHISSQQCDSGMDRQGEESHIPIKERSFRNQESNNCPEKDPGNITRVSPGSLPKKISDGSENNCHEQRIVVQIQDGNLDQEKKYLKEARIDVAEIVNIVTCEANIKNKSHQSNKEKINRSESIPVSKRSENKFLKRDPPNIATVMEDQQQPTTMPREASVQKSNGFINKSLIARLKSLKSNVQKSIKIPGGNGSNSQNVGHGNDESVEITDESRYSVCETKTTVSEGDKQSSLPKDDRTPAVKNAGHLSVVEKRFVTPKDSKCTKSDSVQVRQITKSVEANNTPDTEMSNYLFKSIHEPVCFSTENRTQLQDIEIVDPKTRTHRTTSEKESEKHKNSELQAPCYVVNNYVVNVLSGSSESSAPNAVDFIQTSPTSESLAIKGMERLKAGKTFTKDNSNHTSTGKNVLEDKQETQLQNDQIPAKDNSSFSPEDDVPNSLNTNIRTAQLSESATLDTVASDIRQMKRVKIEKTSMEKKIEESFSGTNVFEKLNEDPDKLTTDSNKSFDNTAPSLPSDIGQVMKSTIGGMLSDKRGYAIKNEQNFSKTEDVPVSQGIVCSKPCITPKLTSVSSKKIIEISTNSSIREDITNPVTTQSGSKATSHTVEEKMRHFGANSRENKEQLSPEKVPDVVHQSSDYSNTEDLLKIGLVKRNPLPVSGETKLDTGASTSGNHKHWIQEVTLNVEKFGVDGSNGGLMKSGLTKKNQINLIEEPSLVTNSNKNTRDTLVRGNIDRNRSLPDFGLSERYPAPISSGPSLQQICNQNDIPSCVRQLNETQCGGFKQAGISMKKDTLSGTYESESTKHALKNLFQTVLYQRNGGEDLDQNRQEVSIKNEKQTTQSFMPATRCQNSEAVSNDTKFNSYKSEPAINHSIKCSQQECNKDSRSFATSLQEVLNQASQTGNEDESNGETLFGVCHEDNEGLTEDFAISGKRKQEEKKAEGESNKRQKCDKQMEYMGLSQAVVNGNVKLSKKERRRQQQESRFLWKNIRTMEVQYNTECNSLLRSVKMLASMDPSLTEKLKCTFKESLAEMGRKLLLELHKLKQKNDEWENKHRVNRPKSNNVSQATLRNKDGTGKGLGEGQNEENDTKSNMSGKMEEQQKMHQEECFKMKQEKPIVQGQTNDEVNQIQNPLNKTEVTITQSLNTHDHPQMVKEVMPRSDTPQENNCQTNSDQRGKIIASHEMA